MPLFPQPHISSVWWSGSWHACTGFVLSAGDVRGDYPDGGWTPGSAIAGATFSFTDTATGKTITGPLNQIGGAVMS